MAHELWAAATGADPSQHYQTNETTAAASAVVPSRWILEMVTNSAKLDVAPHVPAPKYDELKWLSLLSSFRGNLIEGFPRKCWEEDVLAAPFLGRKLVMVNSPRAIREMLVAKADHFGRLSVARRVLSPVVGRGIALSEGVRWKQQRHMLAPAFGPRMIPTVVKQVVSVANIAIERLRRSDRTVTDLYRELGYLALQIAAATMFSLSNQHHLSEIRELMAMYGAELGRPRIADFILPSWAPTVTQVRRTLFRRRIMKLIRQVIRERAEMFDPDHPRDLFDLLYHQTRSSSEVEMADHVSTMIAAGHETTAMTLFWALEILAENTDLQRRVASEVAAMSFDSGFAVEHLAGLRYTEAVIRETLRLYPQAFLIGRRAVTNTMIGDCTIPRHSTVLVPIWMLHRNPNLWKHADVFDPARFADGCVPERFSYLPFGAGPNVCLGSNLAITEATLVLAMIIRNFQIRRADDRRPVPQPSLSLRPDYIPRYIVDVRNHA